MILYEVCYCEKCGKTYKGKFKMHVDGTVTCFSCEHPENFSVIKIETAKYQNRDKLLYSHLSEMLMKDLETLYPLFQEEQDEILSRLSTPDGQLDMGLIYFQQNPLSLVRYAQEVSIIAAHFIIQYINRKDNYLHLYRYAETVIKKYLQLRITRLTEEEIQRFWRLLSQEELQEMKSVINYV